MKYKIKLPKNSILVFFFLNLFPFIAFTIINMIFINQSECKTTTNESTVDKPKIEVIKPTNWSWKLDQNYTSEFIISSEKNEIDLSSLRVNLVTPNLGRYKFIHTYKYNEDPSFFEIEHIDSQYLVKFSPNELPQDDTVLWYFEICDTKGNTNNKFYYSSTTHTPWDLFLSIPGRMLLFFIIYAGIFGITINYPKYGYVYDSISKKPISGAIVRLFKDKTLLGTAVTNNSGFFYMNPPKGEYYISVVHPEYSFPSEILSKINSDGEMRNLYFGKTFTSTGNESIRLCIPLDKLNNNKKIHFFSKLSQQILDKIVSINVILFSILIIATIIYMVIGYWEVDFENIFQIVYSTIFVSAQLTLIYRAKNIKGKVIDKKGKPIEGVKLILLDSEFKQLKDSTVTDKEGKYLFIVPKGDYAIIPIHNNYEIVVKKPYLIDGRKGIRKVIKKLSVLTPKIVMKRKE